MFLKHILNYNFNPKLFLKSIFVFLFFRLRTLDIIINIDMVKYIELCGNYSIYFYLPVTK